MGNGVSVGSGGGEGVTKTTSVEIASDDGAGALSAATLQADKIKNNNNEIGVIHFVIDSQPLVLDLSQHQLMKHYYQL
jgi:hypothetical protein